MQLSFTDSPLVNLAFWHCVESPTRSIPGLVGLGGKSRSRDSSQISNQRLGTAMRACNEKPRLDAGTLPSAK